MRQLIFPALRILLRLVNCFAGDTVPLVQAPQYHRGDQLAGELTAEELGSLLQSVARPQLQRRLRGEVVNMLLQENPGRFLPAVANQIISGYSITY